MGMANGEVRVDMLWTDAKKEELRMAWEEGLPASVIAEKLGDGISRNAVIGKAHRMGLPARPSPVKGGESELIEDETGADGATVVKSRSPAKPRSKVVKVQLTTLLDLSDKICKWPIGHPGDSDFHFCGKPSQTGFPYCGEHCVVAYQAQMPRRDRPARPLPPVRVR